MGMKELTEKWKKKHHLRKILMAAVRIQKSSDSLKTITCVTSMVVTKHAAVTLEEITYFSYFMSKKFCKAIILSAIFACKESIEFLGYLEHFVRNRDSIQVFLLHAEGEYAGWYPYVLCMLYALSRHNGKNRV